MKRWLLLLAAVAALVPAAVADGRARLELTVEPGVAIPCNRFIDTEGKRGDSHLRVKNQVGFSLNVSLLLNDWEFHYGLGHSPIGNVDLRVPEDAWNAARQVLEQQGVDVPREVNAEASGAFVFHSITLGYRFRVLDRAGWRLFVPNGLGAAIVTGDGTSRPLYGGAATLGFGVDWQFLPRFRYVLLNLTARYTFHITEMSQEYTGFTLIAGGSPWDAAVAMMHLVTINLGVAGRW